MGPEATSSAAFCLPFLAGLTSVLTVSWVSKPQASQGLPCAADFSDSPLQDASNWPSSPAHKALLAECQAELDAAAADR